MEKRQARKSSPTKSPAKSSAKPAVKAAAKPAVKSAKPVAKSLANAAAKPAVKAAKPTEKSPAKPAAKRSAASDYAPNENEKYMSARQITYFRRLFEEMRRGILNSAEQLIDTMKDDVNAIPDENDRASKESEFAVELREREREYRLLQKIDLALIRIKEKKYGYCEECGDSIGLQRLLARPVATLCFECKSLQEEYEKTGGASSFPST